MEKRKRKELNLEQKVKLINESNGKSQRQLAEQFGIGKTQVQTILKRKAEYLDGWENNASNDRKRLCKRSPVEELNITVWEWFQKMQQNGVRISGPMVQERALLYAQELKIPDSEFKGWLSRFRDRHNISFVTVCGESGSVNVKTVEDWKVKLIDMIKDYAPEDIYNMDETGLYYRALPDKSLCVKGQDFKGGKKSKERLTAMLCVNMKGEFEKPLVIGKSEKPRCFKHVNLHDLPVTWKWNRKAWMTSEIFKDWIKSFNNRMKCQNRNVILFLDNATSRPEDLNLSNVKIQFLPKNTTSVLQPLDQGILQNMKTHYRKRLIRSVLARIDDGENVSADVISKSVNVLQAVRFVCAAVKDIKAETVTNCFRKAGFILRGESQENEFEDDDIPLMELADLMRASAGKITIEEEMSIQDFLNIDIELPVHEELDSDWENNLVQSMRDKKQNKETDADADAEIDEDQDSDSVMTHKKALLCIDQLRLFFLAKQLSHVLPSLDFAQESIEKETVTILSKSKQTTLDQYFK